MSIFFFSLGCYGSPPVETNKTEEFGHCLFCLSRERTRCQRLLDNQKIRIAERGRGSKYCWNLLQVSYRLLRSSFLIYSCYRCGSKKHSLSRCKKPSNPADPFPYASCFVCNGKGHLASACPQNKSKGVYPNGGSCKLCGDTSHLAKNCGIREKGTGTTFPRLIGQIKMTFLLFQ